jgi:hypothetical protein
MIVFYLTILVLLVAYIGIYRLVVARAPHKIGDLIALMQQVKLHELENLLSLEMNDLMMHRLNRSELRSAEQELWNMVSTRMKALEADARLILAFTQRQVALFDTEPLTHNDERRELLQGILHKAKLCFFVMLLAATKRKMLMLRRWSHGMLYWNTRNLAVLHRETVIREFKQLALLFLQLCETYGQHHSENLLAALDSWDLAEEY